MNSNDIDYTKRFKKMIKHPENLLKQSPLLLQKNLSVEQIKKLVEIESTEILQRLLNTYETHDPTKGASLKDLVEMVVVGCVFYYQKTDLLLHLFPQLEQKDLTEYMKHIKGEPTYEFLDAIEPYVIIPCRHRCDEILEAIRTKRSLTQEVAPKGHEKNVKKM